MLIQPSSSRWPEGASSSIVFSVNFDAELGILAEAPDARDRMKTLSVGEYGATCGVPRLLDIFDEFGIAATWFVPSENMRTYPDLIERVLAAGHEPGNRGVNLTASADPMGDVAQGQEEWQRRFGVLPTGYRIPRGQFLPDWSAQLAAHGITWTSSWDGDDLPYWHPGTDVIDIPWHHQLADYGYFVFNLDPPIPAGSPRIASPDDVLDNWLWEFDAADREGACTVISLNPETIGTPANALMLKKFISHIRNADAWVGTGGQVASWWREVGGPNDPRHPIEVYCRERAKEVNKHD